MTFLAAIAVYGATLLRGVSSSDPAEMQSVPTVLGITHPTTYPLWTLLGYAWTKLPVASPALLMNALSAGLFAASAAGLVLLAAKLGARPIVAAAMGGATFAFAGETWSRATQAEVHALHTLLVVLALLAWVTAEATGSRRAALALVGLVGLGLAHHRLMLITGVPIVGWFFIRHLAWLRSPRFAFYATVLGGAPLLFYLYLPLRAAHGAPIVNADGSHGWLAAASAFRGNQTVWSSSALGNWLGAFPDYARLASQWVGWVPLLLALLGAAVLVRDRPAVAAGLIWAVVIPTYGVTNRELDDVHHRWLIVPLLVVTLFASVGAEAAARAIIRFATSDVWRKAAVRRTAILATVAVMLPLLVPAWELTEGFSRYDRSRDGRDARNATRILRALEANAVVWSDWDVRTSLQYEHFVGKMRPDVKIVDHRAYVAYKTGNDADVGLAVAGDARYAHRPVYVIPGPGSNRRVVAKLKTRFKVQPVLELDDPSESLDHRERRRLYIVKR